jgi:Dolichyl-phosphate-mannose-protein mannosyltransferase
MTLLRADRLRDAWPPLAVASAWAVSRVAAYAAGVRFDAGTLGVFWQLIEPDLLRHRLLESLYYLHSQPPLFNLFLGAVLKTFPTGSTHVFQAVYSLLGLVEAVTVYALLARLGTSRAVAVAGGMLVAVLPATILYENWLFYEFPVAVALLLAALALHRFVERGSVAWGIAFFTLLAAVMYTRSVFQHVWLAAALLLVLVSAPQLWRRALLTAAIPLMAVALLYAKNVVEFGVFGTSSWSGMNVAQVIFTSVPVEERAQLVREGTLSRVSLADPFSDLSAYRGAYEPPAPTGIPVLDRAKMANGDANRNNLAYVEISRKYMRDALALIRERPDAYADSVLDGLQLFLTPSSDFLFVEENRQRIRPYEHVFNGFVLGRTPHVRGIAWGILLAYLIAFVYGSIVFARALRRRDGDAASVTVAFVWLTVVYVTLVLVLAQVTENQRIRYLIDPLAVVLVALAVHAASRNRPAHRAA